MMSAKTERMVKRWGEQRWALDSIIQAVGMEWDQPRLGYTMYPAGPDAIAFADDGFTLGNLFIEHGHRHEPMTAVVGPPVLAAVPTQINYPLGSFVNRYFINRIERLDAFIDNVKPVTQSLLALLRRRPLTIGRAYWRGWRFVWRALRVRKCKGAGGPVLVITAALFVPPVALGLVILERFVPGWFTWIPAWLKVGGSIAGIGLPMLLPYLLGALGELRKEFGPTRKEPLLAGAEAALRDAFPPGGRPARVYAVMGHTHDQRVDVIGNGAGEAFYLNTGTWTPLWPRDRSDLIGRVYYSFIRFERGVNGEYRHQALVWDDQAGAARAAPMVLFTE